MCNFIIWPNIALKGYDKTIFITLRLFNISMENFTLLFWGRPRSTIIVCGNTHTIYKRAILNTSGYIKYIVFSYKYVKFKGSGHKIKISSAKTDIIQQRMYKWNRKAIPSTVQKFLTRTQLENIVLDLLWSYYSWTYFRLKSCIFSYKTLYSTPYFDKLVYEQLVDKRNHESLR